MNYDFTITDSNNFTEEQIMSEAAVIAQEEFEIQNIFEQPRIKLISVKNLKQTKIYQFLASNASSENESKDKNTAINLINKDNDDLAASPLP